VDISGKQPVQNQRLVEMAPVGMLVEALHLQELQKYRNELVEYKKQVVSAGGKAEAKAKMRAAKLDDKKKVDMLLLMS
jgi:hypothetical protein